MRFLISASCLVTVVAFVSPSSLNRPDVANGPAVKAVQLARHRQLVAYCTNTKDNGDDCSPEKEDEESNKPKSRLALLADDWLEEEEDELQMYWERFEANKEESGKQTEVVAPKNDDSATEGGVSNNLTTEQRLERYFDRRGIHKASQRKYASQIEQAIATARSAPTPEQSIAALAEVQPYLQVRTRLGGMALYELALALWQRDGEPDEAFHLVRELLEKNANPHVQQKVQQLARRETPPKRSPSTNTFWQGFLDSNQWWN